MLHEAELCLYLSTILACYVRDLSVSGDTKCYLLIKTGLYNVLDLTEAYVRFVWSELLCQDFVAA